MQLTTHWIYPNVSIAPPPNGKATPPINSASRGDRPPSASESLIEARIAEAASALWWAEITRWTLGLVIGTLTVGIAWLVMDHWIYSPGPFLRCGLLAAFLAGVTWYVTRRIFPLLHSRVLPDYAARSLERDLPELRHALTSYVTLKGSTDTAGLGGRVVRSIGAATANKLKSHDALPAEATGTMRWWIATAIALAALVGYALASPKSSLRSAARLALPLASIEPPHRVKITDVVPGDTDAIAGRSIDVAAKAEGLRADESVSLRWWNERGDAAKIVELDRDVDGGPYRFGGSWTLPTNARGMLAYEVIAGDAIAGPFNVHVRDIPVVAVESVTQTPPQYTGKPPHTHSGGAITAIDGTDVLIRASVNRPISRAVIEFNPRPLGDTTRATAGATEMIIAQSGTELSVDFRLRGARGRSAAVELDSYRIQVWDQSDQANADPIIYPIRVIADLPPDVAIMMPVTTPKDVPLNAQQMIEVHAADSDFGLSEIRLEVRRGIDMVDQPVIWKPSGGKTNVTGNQVAEYRFRPGPKDRGGLNLQIGDTVQVVAVATDNRTIPGDKTAEPNIVRTDPITLKIVASDDLPQPGDPEAEGMSSPDEKPAADPSGDESGQSQSGESQSSESKPGQSQSGESKPQEKQSGGEKASDDGQPQPQGEPQSGGGGGAGGEKATKQQPGQNQSGGDPGGGSDDGQNPSDGNAQPGSGRSDGDGMREGEPGGDGQPSDGQPSDGQPSDGQAGDGQPDPSRANQGQPPGQGGDSQPTGGQPSDGESSSGTQSDQQQSGDQQRGDSGEPSGSGATSGDKNSGAPSAGEGAARKPGGKQGQPGGEKSAPKHDGEAFERIKEYLDQQKNGEGSSAGQGEKQSDGSSETDADGETSQTDGGKETEASQGTPQEGGTPQGDGTKGQVTDGKPQGDGNKGTDATDASTKSPASNSPASNSSDGNTSDGGKSDGGKSDGTKPSDAKPPSGKPSDNGSPTGQPQPGEGTDMPESKSPSKDKTEDSLPGTGNGQSGEGKGGDAPLPTDPVDEEYAKEATDMVLDYLEQTRDQPDEQLLDKLNWTQDDLKRFQDRWKNIRDLDGAPTDAPETSKNIEESLRSLGLRNPSSAPASLSPDKADSLKNIRDSGNRTPPPKAYRDAFDAFRRSMNQSR